MMKSWGSFVLLFHSVISFTDIHQYHTLKYGQFSRQQMTSPSALFGKKKFNTGKPLRSLSFAVRKRLQRSSPFVVLVDANNVRGMDGGFRLTNYDLLRALSVWQRSETTTNNNKRSSAAAEMVLVCVMDHGTLPCISSYQGVNVVFAGPDRTADDVIAEDCQWWLSRNFDVLVATSDRELVDRCIHPPDAEGRDNQSNHNEVEVFESKEMSNLLRKVWNQNVIMRRSTIVPSDFTSLDPLHQLEHNIRSHFGYHQQSQTADEQPEGEKNGSKATLGDKQFLETTWQRVLLAEQLRMILLEDQQHTNRTETNEECRSPELQQYRLKYSNITSQVMISIFDDQRIRHDRPAQEALRHYLERATIEKKLELLVDTTMDDRLRTAG